MSTSDHIRLAVETPLITRRDPPPTMGQRIARGIESVIFNVRWVLPLFYAGLIVVLALYGWTYVKEITHIALAVGNSTTDDMKVAALDAVDIVMVANLVKMVIAGSYHSFVSKLHGRKNENVSSGTLKVKIATSVIVVATIHLLRMFISTEHVDPAALHTGLCIYGAFLASAAVLGGLEYLHIIGERHETH